MINWFRELFAEIRFQWNIRQMKKNNPYVYDLEDEEKNK